MPTANFKITTVGNAAAVSASTPPGLGLNLTHIAIGAGSYTPTGSETALADRREVATISSATKVGAQLTITATFSSAAYTGAAYNIGEVGIFAGDPASGGTLYCVSALVVGSTSGYGARGGSIGDYEFTFVLTLAGAGTVNASIDPTAAVSAAMMTAHLAAADPHPQYKLPPGAAIQMFSATVPSGWYECDGSAKSRTADAALFAAIGTTYGAGDGSTTFNIPDMRGEFARGWDHGRGVDAGRALGTAQSEDLKSHDHAALNGASFQMAGGSSPNARLVNDDTGPTDDSTNTKTAATGGTETRPRNVAVMWIIKR